MTLNSPPTTRTVRVLLKDCPFYSSSDDVLVFIKFFNPDRHLTEYKGTLILSLASDLVANFPNINKLIGQPLDTKINLYLVCSSVTFIFLFFFKELKPDKIIPLPPQTIANKIKDCNFLNNDGSIIIAELAEQSNEEVNTVSYFKTLFNRIEVK